MRLCWHASLCVLVASCAARGPQPGSRARGSQDPLPDPPPIRLPELEVAAAEKWPPYVRFISSYDAAEWPYDTVPSADEFQLLYAWWLCARVVRLRPSGDAEWTPVGPGRTVFAPLVVGDLVGLVPTMSLSYPRDRDALSFTFAGRFLDRLQVGSNDFDVQTIDQCDWVPSRIKLPRFPDREEPATFQLIQSLAVTIEVPDLETLEAYQRGAAPTIASTRAAAPAFEAEVIGFHDRERHWDSRCHADFYANSVAEVWPLANGWYRPEDNPLGRDLPYGREIPNRVEQPFAVVTRAKDGRCSVHVDHLWGATAGRPEDAVRGPFQPAPYPCPGPPSSASAAD